MCWCPWWSHLMCHKGIYQTLKLFSNQQHDCQAWVGLAAELESVGSGACSCTDFHLYYCWKLQEVSMRTATWCKCQSSSRLGKRKKKCKAPTDENVFPFLCSNLGSVSTRKIIYQRESLCPRVFTTLYFSIVWRHCTICLSQFTLPLSVHLKVLQVLCEIYFVSL